MNVRKVILMGLMMVILMAGSSAAGVYAAGRIHPPAQPSMAATGTGFTYQGYLADGGEPADGSYDLQFVLFNDPIAGTAAGGISVGDLDVTDGVFTVLLDFGDLYDGTARWLEIGVRPGNDTGPYTTLSPRQALTSAPYANYALAAPWSGLTGVPPDFGDGVDDDTTYAAGNQLELNGTVFDVEEGSGSGLDADLLDGNDGSFYRNASNINAGALSASRFSAYSDLSSEGYLNNNADDDLLTRAQADARYQNEGELTSEYLGLPPTAFVAQEGGKDYYLGARIQSNSGSIDFGAPVFLPDGAVVNSLAYYFLDDDPMAVTQVMLRRITQTGSAQVMGNCTSSYGETVCEDTSLSYATIDNENYLYWVTVYIGWTYPNIAGYKVVIEYTTER